MGAGRGLSRARLCLALDMAGCLPKGLSVTAGKFLLHVIEGQHTLFERKNFVAGCGGEAPCHARHTSLSRRARPVVPRKPPRHAARAARHAACAPRHAARSRSIQKITAERFKPEVAGFSRLAHGMTRWKTRRCAVSTATSGRAHSYCHNARTSTSQRSIS